MAIFSNQQNKQKYMIWIFVAVLIVTGTVIYFGFIKDKINFGRINIPNLGSGVENISIGKVNIDFEMLDKKEFKDLTPFEDAFPFDGKVGREEPFKPNQ
jgi:hypothetical protein